MKKKYDRCVDRYTGRKLVSVQAFVSVQTHRELLARARNERVTLTQFIRRHLEDLSGLPFSE